MREVLYTIPVNEAFDADCECPVCQMYNKLQDDAVDFVMGASYMEDDVRMETDKIGFCEKHLPMMYKNQNRLGMGLMMLTYMDRQMKEMEKLSASKPRSGGIFKKSEGGDALYDYLTDQQKSCYVCKRMERSYNRYLATIFVLYQAEEDFRKKFAASKGFCMKHYAELHSMAGKELSGKWQEEFLRVLNERMLTNFKRVRDDLEWFTDKFDYRNADAPWKNSKDALIRAVQKTNSLFVEEGGKKKS